MGIVSRREALVRWPMVLGVLLISEFGLEIAGFHWFRWASCSMYHGKPSIVVIACGGGRVGPVVAGELPGGWPPPQKMGQDEMAKQNELAQLLGCKFWTDEKVGISMFPPQICEPLGCGPQKSKHIVSAFLSDFMGIEL